MAVGMALLRLLLLLEGGPRPNLLALSKSACVHGWDGLSARSLSLSVGRTLNCSTYVRSRLLLLLFLLVRRPHSPSLTHDGKKLQAWQWKDDEDEFFLTAADAAVTSASNHLSVGGRNCRARPLYSSSCCCCFSLSFSRSFQRKRQSKDTKKGRCRDGEKAIRSKEGRRNEWKHLLAVLHAYTCMYESRDGSRSSRALTMVKSL